MSDYVVQVLAGRGARWFGVAFSPDGRLLATADHEGLIRVYEARSLRIWNVATGADMLDARLPTEWAPGLRFQSRRNEARRRYARRDRPRPRCDDRSRAHALAGPHRTHPRREVQRGRKIPGLLRLRSHRPAVGYGNGHAALGHRGASQSRFSYRLQPRWPHPRIRRLRSNGEDLGHNALIPRATTNARAYIPSTSSTRRCGRRSRRR
jgi:hypothetical protein